MKMYRDCIHRQRFKLSKMNIMTAICISSVTILAIAVSAGSPCFGTKTCRDAGSCSIHQVHNPELPSTRSFFPAFGNPKYFSNKVVPSNKAGVELRCPNFDVLFDVRISFGGYAYSSTTTFNFSTLSFPCIVIKTFLFVFVFSSSIIGQIGDLQSFATCQTSTV